MVFKLRMPLAKTQKGLSCGRWLMILLGIVLVCGCTRAPIEESSEFRAATYFSNVFAALDEQRQNFRALDERILELERNAERLSKSDKELFLQSGRLSLIEELTKRLHGTKLRLEHAAPTPQLVMFHQSLLEAAEERIQIVSSLGTALGDENDAQIVSLLEQEKRLEDRLVHDLRKGLTQAGFSSDKDIVRVLEIPRTPMTWLAAISLLAIVVAVALFAVGMLHQAVLFAFTPLILLTERWGRFGETVLARATVCIMIVTMAFIVSVVGSGLAGLSERFMFPRTQLAPWFVIGILGAQSFMQGLLTPANLVIEELVEGESSKWVNYSAFFLCLVGLFGFLWAAMAKGTLLGPWYWVNQGALNWFR